MNIYLIILGVIAYIIVFVVGSYFMYKFGVYLATRSKRAIIRRKISMIGYRKKN